MPPRHQHLWCFHSSCNPYGTYNFLGRQFVGLPWLYTGASLTEAMQFYCIYTADHLLQFVSLVSPQFSNISILSGQSKKNKNREKFTIGTVLSQHNTSTVTWSQALCTISQQSWSLLFWSLRLLVSSSLIIISHFLHFNLIRTPQNSEVRHACLD